MLVERYARAHKGKTPTYVFERRGKRYSVNYASQLLKKAVREAGLNERLHFHSLRHGFGSNLLRANANPVHVQKLMGHANLSTTMRYLHVEQEDLEQAISKLDKLHARSVNIAIVIERSIALPVSVIGSAIEFLECVHHVIVRYVRVYHGCRYVAVAEQFLDNRDWRVSPYKFSGGTVSKAVEMQTFIQPCLDDRGLETA